MKSEEQPVEPFVSVQRRVISDKRNGKLTYREYELYVWMRLQANPYGIAAVSSGGLLEDLPHFRSTDHINRVLKSLLEKKYIYYQSRQGRGGSFEVHFGDWKRPDKTIKQLNELFARDKLRSSETSQSKQDAEVSQNSNISIPKSKDEKSADFTGKNSIPATTAVRGYYNDTDTRKGNYADESSGAIKRKTTASYEPNGDAERRCKEIALAVKDPYIHFILSVLKDQDGGIEVIEEGYESYLAAREEYARKGEPVKNPAALFNSCVITFVETKKLERMDRESEENQ